MLLIQFLLGMAVNLFVTIPTDHPGARPSAYFTGVAQSVTWAITQGDILLILRASFGLVLVAGALFLLFQGIRSRIRSLVMTTGFGAFGVIAAGFNGGNFLNYNEDFSSILMATGLAVAAAAYVIGLYVTARNPTSTASH